MRFEAVIGMEVHVQLQTCSKMFCGCDAQTFGAPPNTATCPVCLGLPGALPVPNRAAVEQAIQVALALHCHVAQETFWERKNYFYPDLPKGYQITQYQVPLGRDGWLDIDLPGATGRPGASHRIRLARVHLEEDTARLVHAGAHSWLDFNRAGVPLLEIVTQPDFRTPAQTREYLVALRTLLRTLGVSTADMEKGAMRCEPNVSLRPQGQPGLGTKVEIKNLNSFRSVAQALEFEIDRQAQVLAAGDAVRQVTMNWDERAGRTVAGRTKESAHDYRYFPEPDLPLLRISEAWVDAIRARMPVLPTARRERYVADLGLPHRVARILVADPGVADWFDQAVAAAQERDLSLQALSHWVTGEMFHLMKVHGAEIGELPVSPHTLVALVALVEHGTLSPSNAKDVLAEMAATGASPGVIVEAWGLVQISDRERLQQVVNQVLAAHPDQVADYRAGKQALFRWFVGQVMRATRDQAHVPLVIDLLHGALEEPGP